MNLIRLVIELGVVRRQAPLERSVPVPGPDLLVELNRFRGRVMGRVFWI